MKEVNHLEEMICNEMRKINSQGELNPASLQVVNIVIDILKDIYEIKVMEQQLSYPEEGSYRNGYNNSYGNMYPNNGHSMGMGSYNSYGSGRNIYYDNGYSRHTATDQMINKLEAMMQDASSSKDKNIIQHCIDELKNQ